MALSALAGDCDIFAAVAAVAGGGPGFWYRACDFVGVHPAKRGGLGEFTRLAISPRCGGSAFVAARKAFIDAVSVRLIGDDEDAAVGQSGGRTEHRADGKCGQNSHGAPA